jgi:hypothetical protein
VAGVVGQCGLRGRRRGRDGDGMQRGCRERREGEGEKVNLEGEGVWISVAELINIKLHE